MGFIESHSFQSPYKFIFYMDENIAANWDLYMITILTLLLGIIMYTRRPFQQPEQQVPRAQQQLEPQVNEVAAAHINPAPPEAAPALAESAPRASGSTGADATSAASGSAQATLASSSTAARGGSSAGTSSSGGGTSSSGTSSSSSNTLDPTD